MENAACEYCESARNGVGGSMFFDRWCCRARWITQLVGATGRGQSRSDVRRDVAARIRERYPAEWPLIAGRLRLLLGGERRG